MKAAFELAGEARAQLGRTDSRRLRKAGKVPAVMYGGGEAPEALVLDHNALTRQMSREAFYTSILTLKIGSKSQQVVVKDVQRHPARPLIMHLDFQRVREDQSRSRSPCRIHFTGEANAKGVKDQGGVVEHLMTDVEIRLLAAHLPEYLELDVTALELNQIYHLSDIKLPEGVTLVAACRRPRPPGRRGQSAAPGGNRRPGRGRDPGGRSARDWRRPSPGEGEAAAGEAKPDAKAKRTRSEGKAATRRTDPARVRRSTRPKGRPRGGLSVPGLRTDVTRNGHANRPDRRPRQPRRRVRSHAAQRRASGSSTCSRASMAGTSRTQRKLKVKPPRSLIAGQRIRLVEADDLHELERPSPSGAPSIYYKIPTEHVLVAYDELDLPPGRAQLRFDGSSAGHNGIGSVIEHIGTKFWRLRFGVGHPRDRADARRPQGRHRSRARARDAADRRRRSCATRSARPPSLCR